MLDWLRGIADSAREALATEVARFNNREFMEAVVAGCTMVAAADGNIDASEKQKMLGYVKVSRELRVFDTAEVVKAFNRCAEVFEFDQGAGVDEAMRAIRKLRGKPDQANAMVRVCCVIGAADGSFDDVEKDAVRRICDELGVAKGAFGL